MFEGPSRCLRWLHRCWGCSVAGMLRDLPWQTPSTLNMLGQQGVDRGCYLQKSKQPAVKGSPGGKVMSIDTNLLGRTSPTVGRTLHYQLLRKLSSLWTWLDLLIHLEDTEPVTAKNTEGVAGASHIITSTRPSRASVKLAAVDWLTRC